MVPLQSKIVLGIRRFLKRIYTPNVRRIVEKAGLAGVLKEVYNRIDCQQTQILQFEVSRESMLVEVHSAKSREDFESYQGAERPVITDLLDNLHGGDVFYDVGAWVGTYSGLAKIAHPDITVHAFEPGSRRYQRLLRSIELNGLQLNTHQVALSTKNSTLALGPNGELKSSGSGEQVTVVDANRYIAENDIKPPTVVKIDVEGGELDVIRGLDETLSRSECRLIYCEVHPQHGVEVDEFREMINSLGFSTEILHTRNKVTFIRGSK